MGHVAAVIKNGIIGSAMFQLILGIGLLGGLALAVFLVLTSCLVYTIPFCGVAFFRGLYAQFCASFF